MLFYFVFLMVFLDFFIKIDEDTELDDRLLEDDEPLEEESEVIFNISPLMLIFNVNL